THVGRASEELIERASGRSGSRRRRIELPIVRQLAAQVAYVSDIERRAPSELALIREIVTVNERDRILLWHNKESLIRRGADAAAHGNTNDGDHREGVERAIQDKIVGDTLLDVIDGRELCGECSARKTESTRPIADAIAGAHHGLAAETIGDADARREIVGIHVDIRAEPDVPDARHDQAVSRRIIIRGASRVTRLHRRVELVAQSEI